jgi:lipopolysaccharide/colanic/teichoic acid biosynthesis glycosyltransferase
MPDPRATSSEPGSDYHASPWCRSRWKRGLDLGCATVLSIVLLPLMVIVAFGVKLTSSGPVFFRQRRPGKNGAEFSILKFRTMVASADAKGPVLTRAADPRVTGFGRFLRKWKLDELPQLLNVLRGEMSFVGPRPQPSKLWKQPSIEKEAACVLSVRPGLSSQATLNFRNEEQLLAPLSPDEIEAVYMKHVMPVKVGMDLEYLRTATFFDDLRVIFKTAFRIFCHDQQKDLSLIKECLPMIEAGTRRGTLSKEEYATLADDGH